MAVMRVWRGAAALVVVFAALGVAAAPKGREAKKEAAGDPIGSLVPVQNVGGHSGAIADMVFSAFAFRLFTAGLPGEVAEWDTRSGERLRVWRFPRPAYRLAHWRIPRPTLAVATQNLPNEKGALWLIDLFTGEVRPGPAMQAGPCTALAFSPDGERLAVSRPGGIELHSLKSKAGPVVLKEDGEMRTLQFNKAGEWLLAARRRSGKNGGAVQIWDMSSKDKPKAVALTADTLEDPRAGWSADGKRIGIVSGGKTPAVFLWSIHKAPKLLWKVEGASLSQLLGAGKGVVFHPLVVGVGRGQGVIAGWDHGGRVGLVQIDVKTRQLTLLPTDIHRQHEELGRIAFSGRAHELAATTDPAFRIALYDLVNHKEARRLGPNVRVPRVVGWTADSRGVAWGYQPRSAKNWQRVLVDGLSLTRLEHLSRKEIKGASGEGLPKGWSIKVDGEKTNLSQGGKTVSIDLKRVPLTPVVRSYKDPAGKLRLLVPHEGGVRLSIVDPDTGKVLAAIDKHFSQIADLAVSPDRKFLVVAGGGMSLDVFALDRLDKPILEIMRSEGGDWVAWTKEGYYAGTPGGENLIGWKVVTSPDPLATFYPAQTFRRTLYRPDVIQNVLDAGSVEAVLKKSSLKTRGVEDLRPPRVNLTVVQDKKNLAKVVVTVTAESTAPDQPLEMLRLLVDGRPLPDKQGVKEVAKGQKKASATWTIEKLPGGTLELKVLARCTDVSGVSSPRFVAVPLDKKNRPALHVLAVGLNYASKPGLKLDCALKDAKAISKAFSDACAGKDNLFRQDTLAQQLLEEKATTKGVLAALAELRKKNLKPQDLVVFFYAGHGVRQGREFFLLTHDADLKRLPKTALSGRQLREAFSDMPCQVLLLLDACHSGAAAKGLLQSYKPATDAASRRLADEECGVTLLAAAMGYEKAGEKNGNGLFTQGLLKALGKGKTLPHNHNDGRQYVHHLFSHVFDEVKTLSEDKQHPFLSLPWTTESFAIRQLTKVVAGAGP